MAFENLSFAQFQGCLGFTLKGVKLSGMWKMFFPGLFLLGGGVVVRSHYVAHTGQTQT